MLRVLLRYAEQEEITFFFWSRRFYDFQKIETTKELKKRSGSYKKTTRLEKNLTRNILKITHANCPMVHS